MIWSKYKRCKELEPTSDNDYYVLSIVLDYIGRKSGISSVRAAGYVENKESHLSTTTKTPHTPYLNGYGQNCCNYF